MSLFPANTFAKPAALLVDRHPRVAPALTTLLALAGGQLAVSALVSPLRDYPLEDDWAYAQMVQSVLHGGLRLSEIVGPTAVFHIGWGALWCSLFGFSFTVLTVANCVMSVLAAWAGYLLLRELDFAPQPALLGAVVLLLNPLTLFLAYTFQTDLTFLATLLGALAAFVAAWRRPRPLLWLLLASLLSAAAVLTRQFGIVVPLAAVGLWLRGRRDRLGLAGASLGIGPSLVAYGGYLAWVNTHGGPTWAMSLYTPSTVLTFITGSRFLVTKSVTLLYALGFLALLLLPLFAWLVTNVRLSSARRALGIYTVPVVGFGLVYTLFYLTAGTFNGGSDVFQSRGYLVNLTGLTLKPPVFPPTFWTAVTVIVVPSVALLLGLIARAVGRWRAGAPPNPRLRLIGLTTMGLLGLTFIAQWYHDSYVLPLLPGGIIFLLTLGPREGPPRLRLAYSVVLAFALFSVLSLRDAAAWRRVAWAQEQALLAAGVAPHQISGTSEANYWYLWEPAVAAAKAAGVPLSFATHQRLLTADYVISFTPTPHWVVDTPHTEHPPVYHVCRAESYQAFFAAPVGMIYTLAHGSCPAAHVP